MSTLAFVEFRPTRHSQHPRNPFHAGCQISWLPRFAHLLRPARLLAPLCTDPTGLPAVGDFYFQASNGSVALPVAGYDYNSDWTPLLVRLSLTGMAASLAAQIRPLLSV